jgi:hypothetical protein
MKHVLREHVTDIFTFAIFPMGKAKANEVVRFPGKIQAILLFRGSSAFLPPTGLVDIHLMYFFPITDL